MDDTQRGSKDGGGGGEHSSDSDSNAAAGGGKDGHGNGLDARRREAGCRELALTLGRVDELIGNGDVRALSDALWKARCAAALPQHHAGAHLTATMMPSWFRRDVLTTRC